MLQKKLLSGLFWVLLANLIVKPLWLLGIEVGVQNAIGDEVYGFYAAIFSFTCIFNILLDLGVTNFNTRNIAQHPQLISKHLSGILGIKMLLVGLYLTVTFSVGLLMGYGSHEFRLMALLTLCQVLNSLILYLRSNFEGLLLFKWDSLFSVLDRLLMIIICGLLLWGPSSLASHLEGGRGVFTIYHFVYAQLVAYTLTALLAFAVIARKTKFKRLRWDRRFFLVILRKSAPFAMLVLLMNSYYRIDPILLRRLAGDADAGIYAGAFRLLDALTMVAYLVSIPLLPVFSKICKEMKDAHHSTLSTPGSTLHDSIRIVFWPLMLFSIGTALACSFWAEPLMGWCYHENAAHYVPVFRVVIFGLIPTGLTYIFGTLLTAGGHLRQLNIFAASTLVINIVVNLLLIPRLGAVGSAWASLSAQSFMALTQLALSIHIFKLHWSTFRLPRPKELKSLLSLLPIKR